MSDWDEARIDIIGQNGNDGLHYPRSGDCDLCGEWAGELKEGVCEACAEKYQEKNDG